MVATCSQIHPPGPVDCIACGGENDTVVFGLFNISHSAFNVIFVVVDPPVEDAYADPL